MVFRLQFPGQVYLGAGYVAVDIHAAGHHHHAADVNSQGLGGRSFDYASLLQIKVLYFPVYAVGRVMNLAPCKLNALRHIVCIDAAALLSPIAPLAWPFASTSSRTRFLMAVRISSSSGKGES